MGFMLRCFLWLLHLQIVIAMMIAAFVLWLGSLVERVAKIIERTIDDDYSLGSGDD